MATAEFYYDPLECTICLGEFQSPKILPCFHSFCLVCLEKHVNQYTVPVSGKEQVYFNCPLCRKETPMPQGGLESFQTNFYIEALQERDDEEDPVSSAVQDACDKLAFIDLQLGFNIPDKSPRCRAVRRAVNELANMRYGASKYSSRILRLHGDASEYATKIMLSAGEVRREIEKSRQKAVDLVNAACNETLGKLDEVVARERKRVADYQTQLAGLIYKAREFDSEAINGQLTGTHGGHVTGILEKLTGDYEKMMNTFPSAFDDMKLLSIQIASDAFWQNATAQNIFGKVVLKTEQDQRCSEATVSERCEVAVPKLTQTSKNSSSGDNSVEVPAAPVDSCGNVNPLMLTPPPAQLRRGWCEHKRVNLFEAESVPPLLSVSEESEEMQGAMGGGGVSDASSLIQEPRLVCLIDPPQALDVRRIVPHAVHQQAWISYGQRDRNVYLFDTEGHHIHTVNTGGDAHDITVLDGNTLVVANPAQKRLRQVDVHPESPSHVPGSHTYILPFPATHVAYSALLSIFAYATKNSLQIIFTATGQAQMVISGQGGGSDILTRPSCLAFSHMAGRVVLAAADCGTRMVYMFVESDDPDAKFSRGDMVLYRGEGLGDDQSTPFNPIYVSGHQSLLAVLDKSSNSVALLGDEFSVIGIVRLDSLGLPSPSCLAFAIADSTESEWCWRVWLGTVGGQVAVVDLPQFLCHS